MLIRNSLNGIEKAEGLGDQERERVSMMVDAWGRNIDDNMVKVEYYHGHHDVPNLGFALPTSMDKVEVRCGWGRKAVRSVSRRSVLDSFVSSDETVQARAQAIASANRLGRRYAKAVPGELVTGCAFGRVSSQGEGMTPRLMFHSALKATGLWDAQADELSCGMVIVDGPSTNSDLDYKPALVHLETEDATWVITKSDGKWRARAVEHSMGRCMMVALVNEPDDFRPFGNSRLTKDVRCVIDEYVRGMTRLVYASEIYTSPQKVLLGVSDDTFDIDKAQMYLTNLLLIGKDEDGDVPQMMTINGQSMQPLIDVMLFNAKQFCNLTDVPLSDMSIVTDNPSSAEAMAQAEHNVVDTVENLNGTNGDELSKMMAMALAIEDECPYDGLSPEELSVMANFKNPQTSSIAATADAMVKIAGVDDGFAGSSVFYEGMGFDQAAIQRIQSERDRAQSRSAINAIFAGSAAGDEA